MKELQAAIETVFQDFTDKVNGGNLQNVGLGTVDTRQIVKALNSSLAFKQLVADILISFDLPEENIDAVATYMAYLVVAGCTIQATGLVVTPTELFNHHASGIAD